jgi:hypothetical protein
MPNSNYPYKNLVFQGGETFVWLGFVFVFL